MKIILVKLIATGCTTSQKSPVIRFEVPCIDMRYSRMRHWSRVWNLPSRICITEESTDATTDFRPSYVNLLWDLLISRKLLSSTVMHLEASLELKSTRNPLFWLPRVPEFVLIHLHSIQNDIIKAFEQVLCGPSPSILNALNPSMQL